MSDTEALPAEVDLSLRLLGRFAILIDARLVAIPNNAERLLGYLAVSDCEQHRDVAAGRLWPDGTQGRAMANLRTALWRVRTAHPHLVDVRRDVIGLGSRVRVDYLDVSARTRELAISPDRTDVDVPAASLEAELLPGWDEEWLLLERERHRQARLHALESMSSRLSAAGHFAHAIDLACAAIRIEPLHESAHALLIATHVAEGNHSEAVRQFRAYERLLAEETGLSPSPELVRTLAATSEPSAHPAALPPCITS